MDDSTTDDSSSELKKFVYDIVKALGIVILIGSVLFALTGVWPPLVAVQSGSMEPHMERGDMIVMIDTQKSATEFSSNGIVTAKVGEKQGYTRFGGSGDVIVFTPNGSEERTPVIHRVMFEVNESEDWTDKADNEYLPVNSCSRLPNCPAPSAGFITKGDANPYYDQVSGISKPVQSEWITAKAKFKIPYLGYVRLLFP